jgi:fatty-acyl-CoA synthase
MEATSRPDTIADVRPSTEEAAALSVSLEPLTPLRFLERSAEVHPDKVAIVYDDRRITYREFAREATRLAHALGDLDIRPGDRVAFLCPNVPELLIAHFAVPLAGAVLVAINTRLAPDEIRYILNHCGARVLVVDAAFVRSVQPIESGLDTVEKIVTISDPAEPGPILGTPYGELIASVSEEPLPWRAEDESATIAINYTSGTTGRPKGVMYTHRGAYLNAVGEVIHSEHSARSVYLWTLPMFHCNGWCTAWGVTAIGGRHVCLRSVRADRIWELLDQESITHLNGAPTVLTTIANAPQARELERPLTITTAGAPPSPTTIAELERLGTRIIHVYGLTEVYGPYSVCEYQEGWEDLDVEFRAKLLARQGVGMIQADRMRVVDELMRDVPADGSTMGEIVMRGNNVMAGYFKDPEATAEAFKGGWFHSGDLGVMHPDGYVELRDRAKDIVISGGENISTVEVEQALLAHSDVLEAAVIGVADEQWGERPKAFVVRRPGRMVAEQDLIEHVHSRIARYKAPKLIQFVDELPKTSTGKVQKYALRDLDCARAKVGGSGDGAGLVDNSG